MGWSEMFEPSRLDRDRAVDRRNAIEVFLEELGVTRWPKEKTVVFPHRIVKEEDFRAAMEKAEQS